MTLLGDDLYCKEPHCKKMIEEGYNFTLTFNYTYHKYLSEWIEACDPKEDLHENIIKRWSGKERLYFRYRFASNVPLKEGEDALRIHRAEITIFDEQGAERKRHSFATNHSITEETGVSMIEVGEADGKMRTNTTIR